MYNQHTFLMDFLVSNRAVKPEKVPGKNVLKYWTSGGLFAPKMDFFIKILFFEELFGGQPRSLVVSLEVWWFAQKKSATSEGNLLRLEELCYNWKNSVTTGRNLLHMEETCYIWRKSATSGKNLLHLEEELYCYKKNHTIIRITRKITFCWKKNSTDKLEQCCQKKNYTSKRRIILLEEELN